MESGVRSQNSTPLDARHVSLVRSGNLSCAVIVLWDLPLISYAGSSALIFRDSQYECQNKHAKMAVCSWQGNLCPQPTQNFLRLKGYRSKQFWESFKILSSIRDTKLDDDIRTRRKSWSTPGATVVGMIYGYPKVVLRF